MYLAEENLIERMARWAYSRGDNEWGGVLEKAHESKGPEKVMLAAFTAKYSRFYQDSMRKFEAGNLFWAQRADFQSWLACPREKKWTDSMVYAELDGTRQCLKVPKDRRIARFWYRRIVPDLPFRRAVADGGRDQSMFLEQWSDENQREGWDWR